MSFVITFAKVLGAASVIAFASWLSGKKPELAGFITALPLVSILALAFSYAQYHDTHSATLYARSIIIAVPVSWLFFVPFFFPEKWDIPFWFNFFLGLGLLVPGYFAHQFLLKYF